MIVREVSAGMGNHWRAAKEVSFTWCSVRWGLGAWREGSDGVPGPVSRGTCLSVVQKWGSRK